MLLELSIRNFALIRNVNVKLNNGLSVLMGETGAGKSNIIDALGVLMGGRASKDKINKNSDTAQISAAFDISNNNELKNYLSDSGLSEDEDILVISRDISRKSGSVSRVNGQIVSISALKDISSLLLDIYGQFDNIVIISKAEQRKLIDRLGDSEHKHLLSEYDVNYKSYLEGLNKLQSLTKSPEDIARLGDILTFQIEEIEKSNVLNLNEEEIESRLNMLENMQSLTEMTQEAYSLLESDDINNILGFFSKVVANSGKIINIDQNFAVLNERLNQAYIDIKDIRYELSEYLEGLNYDEEELYKLDKNRNTIFTMKRKYGQSMTDILKFYENAKKELSDLKNYEENILHLKDEISKLKDTLNKKAVLISNGRKSISDKLEKLIEIEFKELEMTDAKFRVNIGEQELSSTGIDDVTFMISFNKDQPLKEFSQVASGGEISRFMLAIKSIEANYDMTPILIFDEIDTGISGNAGKIVAKKLKALSKSHQLIAISHLPQIISRADNQYLVYKAMGKDGIESEISLLNKDERVVELAKVIEGNDYSENTLITAKRMIEDGV